MRNYMLKLTGKIKISPYIQVKNMMLMAAFPSPAIEINQKMLLIGHIRIIIMECSDIFTVNNQKMLIISSESTNKERYSLHTQGATANFDYEKCQLEITDDLNYLDYSLDIYVPQTTINKDGNHIYIGQMRISEVDDENQIGLITYPRVILYQNNTIYADIQPNVTLLFENKTSIFQTDQPCYIIPVLNNDDYLNIGGYKICFEGCLKVDR